MQYLMCRRIYSFTVVGGGVHGKGAGTAPITMTEAGLITKEYRHFIEISPPAGETITEIIVGKGNHGNISGYLIRNFNVIGVAGKETNIGKGKIPGVCRDCRQKGNPKKA